VKRKDGIREVGSEFPFLRSVHGGVERVVEVQPFVGGGGFGEECVVLEGLFGVGGEAVWYGLASRIN
jgi:hypothetical protein